MSEKNYVIEVSKEVYERISQIKKESGKTKRFIVKELLEVGIETMDMHEK